MKIKKVEIPLRPEQFDYHYNPDEQDLKTLENLVKQNKNKEFEDYINKRLLRAELEAERPGIATRDYLAALLDQSIRKRYPELENMSQQEQVNFLKNRVYPGIEEFKKPFELSNKVDIAEGLGDRYKPTGDIELGSDSKNFLDSALHELAHSVDAPIAQIKQDKKFGFTSDIDTFRAKKQALQDFLKKNPKLEKIAKSETIDTTSTEETPLKGNRATYSPIRRMPNYGEYDFQTGQFGSDIIETPIQKYKEVGGEHHLDRPFSLENFINFSKGDLPDIVQSPVPSKFSKIKKIIG